MSYTTLTGRISTDPYFNPRDMRPNYTDWHEIPVSFEDVEIDPRIDLNFGYRAIIEYTDEGDTRTLRFEIRQPQTGDETRRGVPARYRHLNNATVVESALHILCALHFETDLAKSETRAEIEKDQDRRDEDLDPGTED